MRYRMAKRKAENVPRRPGHRPASLSIRSRLPRASTSSSSPSRIRPGGVSGMLVRHQDMFGIMYATHIDNEGFQRVQHCPRDRALRAGRPRRSHLPVRRWPSYIRRPASFPAIASNWKPITLPPALLMPEPHFSREVRTLRRRTRSGRGHGAQVPYIINGHGNSICRNGFARAGRHRDECRRYGRLLLHVQEHSGLQTAWNGSARGSHCRQTSRPTSSIAIPTTSCGRDAAMQKRRSS